MSAVEEFKRVTALQEFLDVMMADLPASQVNTPEYLSQVTVFTIEEKQRLQIISEKISADSSCAKNNRDGITALRWMSWAGNECYKAKHSIIDSVGVVSELVQDFDVITELVW